LLAADADIQSVVHDRFAQQVGELRPSMAAVVEPLGRRISACLRAVTRSSGTMWQGSLFETRGDRLEQQRTAAIAEMRACLLRAAASVAALNELRVSEPRLVAAWPGE
jgi:hypothetical protein